MKREGINKRIDCFRDVKSQIWTAFIVSAGGTITLFPHLNIIFNRFLFAIGSILTILLFISYFKKDDQINLLLNKLEKEN